MVRWAIIVVLLVVLAVIVTHVVNRITRTLKDEESTLDERSDVMTLVFLAAGISTALVPVIGFIATHPFAR